MPIKITVTKNGPYQVSGDLAELELHDAGGNAYTLAGQKRVFLCRCGASSTNLRRQFLRKAIRPRASCTWTAARSGFPLYRTPGKRP